VLLLASLRLVVISGVVRVGEVVLTSPPVPVLDSPPRLSTMFATVVSSRTVLAASEAI